jgi:TetR/AcrR family transcriptional repressor of uid operon
MAERILDAAMDAFARYGVAKTTVEDVAALAGCSRATVYRHFTGKAHIGLAVVTRESFRLLDRIDAAIRDAADLEDVLTCGLCEAARAYSGHRVLSIILRLEPELLLPAIAGPESPVVRVGTEFLVPHVQRHAADHPLAARNPPRFAEWVVRTVISYLLSPSPFVDLADPAQVRLFVRTHFCSPSEAKHIQEIPT